MLMRMRKASTFTMTPSKKGSMKKINKETNSTFLTALRALHCNERVKKHIKKRLEHDEISGNEKSFLEMLLKLTYNI